VQRREAGDLVDGHAEQAGGFPILGQHAIRFAPVLDAHDAVRLARARSNCSSVCQSSVLWKIVCRIVSSIWSSTFGSVTPVASLMQAAYPSSLVAGSMACPFAVMLMRSSLRGIEPSLLSVVI
jgi:hypothetical protein